MSTHCKRNCQKDKKQPNLINNIKDDINSKLHTASNLHYELILKSKNNYIDKNIVSLKVGVTALTSAMHLYLNCLTGVITLFINGIISNNIFKDLICNVIKRALFVREQMVYIYDKLNIKEQLKFTENINFTGPIGDVKKIVNELYLKCLQERINNLSETNDINTNETNDINTNETNDTNTNETNDTNDTDDTNDTNTNETDN